VAHAGAFARPKATLDTAQPCCVRSLHLGEALSAGSASTETVRACLLRRMLSPGTVLAPPEVRVSARRMSCSRTAIIEIQVVTGVAGAAAHRRHSDVPTE
jgi:hypothetical protein